VIEIRRDHPASKTASIVFESIGILNSLQKDSASKQYSVLSCDQNEATIVVVFSAGTIVASPDRDMGGLRNVFRADL